MTVRGVSSHLYRLIFLLIYTSAEGKRFPSSKFRSEKGGPILNNIKRFQKMYETNNERGRRKDEMRLTQARRRIRGGGHGERRCAARCIGLHLARRGTRNADAGVPVEMVFAAGGTITFARIFVAEAGQFVASADAIAVASFRRGLDGNECHRCPLAYPQTITRARHGEKREGRRAPRRAALSAQARTMPRFLRCVRRNGEPRFSRSSIQCCSGIERKTSTIFGSNCEPPHRRISSRAWDIGRALR